MTDFQIKRLPYNLTAQAGLLLVGQYLKRFAQIDQIIDPRFPISGQGGIATSSLLKAYAGLLCTAREGVGRTYMGFDGYAPIVGYLAEA